MSNDLVILALQRLNEAISAAVVIVAASMLLYNLSRGLHDRVVRASSVLLGCVTAVYVGAVFLSIGVPASYEAWLRFQWIGISFAPAALFHLSDTLLATTGLISRGRRRRVVRILYLYGVVFLLTSTGTPLIIYGMTPYPMPLMRAGPLFGLYLVYFAATTVFAFNNVLRARRRALTVATHRRMTYLLLAFLTPALGIFPYSLLFPTFSQANTFWLWVLVNIGDIGIVLMLAFMAYPLSFFGSNKPERVIKSELLEFMLRGPVTGVMVLLVILIVPASRLLGLPGDALMPFVAVATVLLCQWGFSLTIPIIERLLVFTRDQDQARQIQEFSERLLTRADANQLLEATLAATCDYLRAPSAFVASFTPGGVRLEQVVGPLPPSQSWLSSPELMSIASADGSLPETLEVHDDLIVWQSFWLAPLHSTPSNGGTGQVIGVLGIWARSPQPDLQPEEQEAFKLLITRAAHVLDDIRLQEEIFVKLEGVLRESVAVRQESDLIPFGNASTLLHPASEVLNHPSFIEWIHGALKDYWGGPRLTESNLLKLNVVSRALSENDGNPARAVRAVLTRAIEKLKPEGQRSMTMTEWVLYNIVQLRFIEGRKAVDVARRLSMSEAVLFRKQKTAIAEVAKNIAAMEEGLDDFDGYLHDDATPPKSDAPSPVGSMVGRG